MGKLINLREHWNEVFSNTFVKKVIIFDDKLNDLDIRIIPFKKLFDESVTEYKKIKNWIQK